MFVQLLIDTLKELEEAAATAPSFEAFCGESFDQYAMPSASIFTHPIMPIGLPISSSIPCEKDTFGKPKHTRAPLLSGILVQNVTIAATTDTNNPTIRVITLNSTGGLVVRNHTLLEFSSIDASMNLQKVRLIYKLTD